MIRTADSAGRGRGVYATRRFEIGDLIESASVIVVPESQASLLEPTILDSYSYRWGERDQDLAIVLGYGSLYNHSLEPNARYVRRLETLTMEYVAVRPIESGDEILINYNGSVENKTPIHFRGDRWSWDPS